MSEPMSSVEIEDVLSSIRRLVSDDLRPTARAKVSQPATSDAEAEKSDTKLLLTPALRVVARSLSEESPVKPKSPLPRLHLGVQDRRVEDGATFPAQARIEESEFESDTGDSFAPVSEMEWTEDGWVLSRPPVEALEPEASPDPWAQDNPDDDLAAQEAYAQTESAAWADQAAAEVAESLAEASAAAKVQPQAEHAVPNEVEEVVFDEAVLRELVRDILRDELQGKLGERITRNIRKLVHAEIARLVATQELD